MGFVDPASKAAGELDLLRWFAERRRGARRPPGMTVDWGDDMAALRLSGGGTLLLGSDMCLEGVHFEGRDHLEQVGRKALCACLSDCAAMAVRPLAAVVSVALPAGELMDCGQRLLEGVQAAAEEFECPVVGGDTASWPHPLAIDIAVAAEPWPGLQPVTRGGARPGDRLYVTGSIGGSILGKHLTFQPRIQEARRLAESLGSGLHALIDITDGLSLDAWRLCQASGCGAVLLEAELDAAVSAAARELAARTGRTPRRHALSDGEDYELLLAVDPAAEDALRRSGLGVLPVGRCTPAGLHLQGPAGQRTVLEPEGYVH